MRRTRTRAGAFAASLFFAALLAACASGHPAAATSPPPPATPPATHASAVTTNPATETPAGDEPDTVLTSRRWKYAVFFNRMKRRVAAEWHPDTVWKARNPSGTRDVFGDRITVLRVSLAPDGSLKQTSVAQSSGLDVLDQEAARAFRAAQPFDHPPPALVNATTGLISFQFGFHFEVGTGHSTVAPIPR